MGPNRLKTVRRGLAVAIGIAAIGGGSALVLLPSHAAAQGVPHKTCTDPSSSDGVAHPGDTIHCTVALAGVLLAPNVALEVQPTAPTGAFIPVGGCTGFSGGNAPFTYTTTASDNGHLGTPSGICTFTVTTGQALAGDNTLGFENLTIPVTTAPGSSVMQQANECISGNCNPLGFLPMGVAGAGSCVGGTALPVVGGCSPLPGPSPTPSSSPAASASPTPTSSVAAAATTTPFTGGPPHPFPVGATALAASGVALALAGFGGPALLRRRRRAHHTES